MAFDVQNTRRLYPTNLYEPPADPHHIHLAPCLSECDLEHDHVPVCVDHGIEACPASHWLGGHPVPNHPHHVEFDGSTGQWGYTRLTQEEISDLEQLADFERECQQEQEERVRQRIALIRAKAEHDPAFLALAEHLGIRFDEV
jgi:hypothetical protein